MKKDAKHLIASPSLERLKIKLQDFQEDTSLDDKDVSTPNGHVIKDFNSPIWQKTVIAKVTEDNKKSEENEYAKISNTTQEDSVDDKSVTDTDSTPQSDQLVKDFTSSIWKKTPIAVVTENNAENKGNHNEALSISTKEVTEKQQLKTKTSQARRRSSALPCELMEEKLTNLLNSTTAQRAKEAIKHMIGLFKQIQKHPNEEKYYRIFKGRVKFRKHVWSVRNAKLFLTASGWTEIGSFVIFPLSKQTEGPLLLLNKYLRQGNLVTMRSTENRRHYKEQFSLDEVNILGRTSGESRSALMKNSTDRINEFQKPSTNLDEEKENKPRHLRRSVSENALHESSENDDELIPAFLPFRRFSQRSVKEQETIYDLVMENPLSAETAPVGRKHWQGSSSSMEGKAYPIRRMH
ncbi:hypothetical protein OS493_024718 [Desmophyllum pertusum]|uniref:Uncharacterized protein n=1 Tax=Desmophyllum pertusum TaxID=174260 RepID=A0A9X0CWE6_9CNID|nr:hypothetical protein OS493_024718 [Desmophyllum pertusum]